MMEWSVNPGASGRFRTRIRFTGFKRVGALDLFSDVESFLVIYSIAG